MFQYNQSLLVANVLLPVIIFVMRKFFLLIALLFTYSSCNLFEVARRPNIIWLTTEDNSTHHMKLYNENGPDPKAQLMIQFWPSEDEWERLNMAALEVHRKRFNYLFVDGSVKILNPYKTIGTGDLKKPKGIWTNAIDD